MQLHFNEDINDVYLDKTNKILKSFINPESYEFEKKASNTWKKMVSPALQNINSNSCM